MKQQINEEDIEMEYVTLYNGVKMPQLGYGVYQVTEEECERCVLDALEVGYRSLDTAQSYFNEEQVGNAVVKSGIAREDIFLTTKVWIEHYGYEQAKKSVLASMEKLQTPYLDLIFCISLLQIIMVLTGLWKNCMKKAESKPSVYLIFIQIVWWILLPLRESSRW